MIIMISLFLITNILWWNECRSTRKEYEKLTDKLIKAIYKL